MVYFAIKLQLSLSRMCVRGPWHPCAVGIRRVFQGVGYGTHSVGQRLSVCGLRAPRPKRTRLYRQHRSHYVECLCHFPFFGGLYIGVPSPLYRAVAPSTARG